MINGGAQKQVQAESTFNGGSSQFPGIGGPVPRGLCRGHRVPGPLGRRTGAGKPTPGTPAAGAFPFRSATAATKAASASIGTRSCSATWRDGWAAGASRPEYLGSILRFLHGRPLGQRPGPEGPGMLRCAWSRPPPPRNARPRRLAMEQQRRADRGQFCAGIGLRAGTRGSLIQPCFSRSSVPSTLPRETRPEFSPLPSGRDKSRPKSFPAAMPSDINAGEKRAQRSPLPFGRV